MTTVPAQHPPAPSPSAESDRPTPEPGPTETGPTEPNALEPDLLDPDPLHHPDPFVTADSAGTESLLRCWVRETGVPVPAEGEWLELALADGLLLRAPVRHRSAAGWHRFGRAELLPARGASSAPARPADAVTVAALLARSAAAAGATGVAGASEAAEPVGAAGTARASEPVGAAATPSAEHVADLTGRVADSVRRTAQFVAGRRATAEPGPNATPFLRSEQALLLGHPLHPTPKSREGLGGAEGAAFSPELRGALQLHWFAVDRELVAAGEGTLPAWAAQGSGGARSGPSSDLLGVDGTARITAALRGEDGPAAPEGTVLLPVHPWQARELGNRPEVRTLLDSGRLRDLGQAGGLWFPTSSVRTLYRPGSPWMLKLSLGLRITNSRRENLRKELLRGAEVHRLLEAGLGAEWRGAHPGFDIVRDPAWIGLDLPCDHDQADPATASGFDTALRQNPFGAQDRAHCLAGLVAERPWPGGHPSHLAELVHRLAARTGRAVPTVAAEWFLRHLDAVVLPVLWLDGHAGVALEAHQQNTLVLLDEDGWPVGGRYRDNQGYYFRDSAAAALETRLPGLGRASDTFVPDAVADERFAYYLGINHLLGLVGAFGSQGLADERVLLAALRHFLAGRGAETGSPLPERLLRTPTLRCKANLLTRLSGLDELVGPVETQSVYVPYANPLVSAGTPMPTLAGTAVPTAVGTPAAALAEALAGAGA